MSWMVGWLSDNLPVDAAQILSAGHPEALFKASNSHFCILAGGLARTIRHENDTSQAKLSGAGWLVCGLGIQKVDDHCSFLSESDWQSLLSSADVPQFRTIDGHFVAGRWADGKVELFSDQLGLRTLYVAQADEGVFFSTRIDWLSELVKGATVDFRQLGPRWMSFNQLSYQSCLYGVQRLGPGGHGILTARSVQLRSESWLPAHTDDASESTFLSHLQALTNPALQADERISLGLSGGLDSRTLLAVLLNRKAAFDVHIFGSDIDPDVRTAITIAGDEQLRTVLFDDPVPDTDDCIRLMREYAAQAHLCEPVTSIVKLRYYDRIQKQNKLMMDGGFGELLRRQYLNRLLYRGRAALKTLDPGAIASFLSVDRGRIFTNETWKIMEEGVALQLEGVLEDMPPIEELGKGNYLDILAIRTRVPNWGSPEQARLDSTVLNYMPFVQPSLLNFAFSLPVSRRANGRIFRRLINSVHPSLSRYPLSKAGTTYPFQLNTLQAWAWTRIKSRLGRPYQDTMRHQVLERVKPFVMDTLESSDVRSYGAYDREYISRVVREYYSGNLQLANTVDWWLTFELWRKSLRRLSAPVDREGGQSNAHRVGRSEDSSHLQT